MNKFCKICNTPILNHRIYCSNKCKFSDKKLNLKRIRKEKNDKSKILKCNLCEYTTSDINNMGGHAKKHLKLNHNIIDIDYIKYYTIADIIPLITLDCPIENCNWKTIDIENKSGQFTHHLMNSHNMDPEQFCNKYPKYKKLWQMYFIRKSRKDFLDLDERNRIQCKECGIWFKKITNRHLKDKHNGMLISEYKNKHNIYNTASEFTSELQSEITTLHNLKYGSPNINISSLEQEFEKNLIISNIKYITPFLYKGKKYDFYLPKLNYIIEIDGIAFHPNKLINLTIQTINGSINDYNKDNAIESDFIFYRLRYNKENFNSVIELNSIIESNQYIRDYNINYKQQIILKEYFKKYLEIKGVDKLKRYVPLLLKFIRTFQPLLPIPDQEEILKEVINKISIYNTDHIYDITKKEFNNNCSTIGHNYLKSNFQSFWNSNIKNNKTPIEAWLDDDIMRKIIEYRIGLNNSNEIFDFSLHQLVRGLSANRYIVSFFKPMLAATIYKTLLNDCNIKSNTPIVIDPCSGFGGRLLGFKSIYPNGTYIGIEPNIDTYNELIKLKIDSGFNNVYLFNCKWEDFDINSWSNYDLIFTSIPYYDYEIYSNHIQYKSFDDWNNIFIKQFYNSKNCYINLSKELCNKLNLNNNIKYTIKNNTTHFNNNSNNKFEPIILL